MKLGLEGKVALVTGGGRDTGAEVARTLASEGAIVAVNYRSSKADAEQVVQGIIKAGGKATAYPGDVTKYDEVKSMIDQIVKDHGGLSVLVNNAGLVLQKRFTMTDPNMWKRQIDVGLYGVIHTCHAALPHMIEQEDGRIVNLMGDSARVGEAYLSITAASRGGVLSLTKSLAKEVGKHNVRANAVAFGLLETSHTDPEWLAKNREKIERQYALRRMGLPGDVAPLVVFLTSDQTRWITGQVISANGGYRMVG